MSRVGQTVELAVFPLDEVVFFPRTNFPLNIFEPRYLQMVQDSMNSGMPVALTSTDPTESPGTELLQRRSRKTGIVVGFGSTHLVKTRKDGTVVVVLQGQGKARLLEVVQERPYIVCQAEILEEAEQIDEAQQFSLQRLDRILDRWLEENIPDAEQRTALQDSLDTPQRRLETLAMCRIPDADLRQSILEIDDLNERIRFMKFMF